MTVPTPRRAAIYARVSTLDQEPENQLAELRRYVAARGLASDRVSLITASAGPRIAGPRWTGWSRTPSGGGSPCWSAGVWTVWVGISAI